MKQHNQGCRDVGMWGCKDAGTQGQGEPVRCGGSPRCSTWRGQGGQGGTWGPLWGLEGEGGQGEPVRCGGSPRCSTWRGQGGQRSGLFSASPLFASPLLRIFPFTFLLIIGLAACGDQTRTSSKSPAENLSPQESDSKLTFFDVTLEQADDFGRPIWKVVAKQAKYTKEKQIGEVITPYGELYQDGKIVYQVQAELADIEQDGKQLFLKGKIVATDPNNNIVLRGNELEWRPQEDLLIVRNQINGTHKQLRSVAKEARVKTRTQRIDFLGGVVANSMDPPLQMRTEHLIWQIKDEKLISDRPMQIDRYKNNQITDRGTGDTAEVNLKTKIATVTKNAQVALSEPPLQIASNSMTWNLNTEIVTTTSPVRVFHRAEKVTVTGDRGELKIPQKTVYLTGNVNGVGEKRQSIKSQTLTWYLDKKFVEAQGDVVYKQFDPPMTFTGEKAVGNIQAENITVSGGNSQNRVVTEIIPQEKVKNQ